jgi:tetratricopeptide (TPR) repeat protein
MRRIHTIVLVNVVSIGLLFSMTSAGLSADSVGKMERDAQAFYNRKEYAQATNLWLAALEIEPDNKRIQKKIELVYDIKQRKDAAFQKSKLNYRFARSKLREESDDEIRRGIVAGKAALDEFSEASMIDPNDDEIQSMVEEMRILALEIKAAEEKLKLSQATRERVEGLKRTVRREISGEYPDYAKALELWQEVLSYAPKDREALEGVRESRFAIDNRLKFERIRGYMARGIAYFERKDYMHARPEFEEVLKIDPGNRDARDHVERIDGIIQEKSLYEQRMFQAESFYRLGVENLKNNRFDAARDDLESTLALVKDYRDARALLNQVDRLKREYTDRERRKMLEQINVKFQEGILAYSRGKYRAAIDAFVATLTLDKKNGLALEYLERAREALRLEEEEVVGPNSPYYGIVSSLIVSGMGLYEKGDYSESRKKWDSILKLFPNNKIAREYIIRCDIRINPDSKARLVAERLLDGKRSLDGKDYRSALKTFNIIKSIDRNYPGIDNLIAEATGGLARAAAVNLTAADEAELTRRYQAGLELYQRGGKDNIQKALAQFRIVVQKDPSNIKAAVVVNKIESELRIGGEGERAQVLTDRQRELVNRYYYSGINYYTNNNFSKAVQEWRKVLVIDPGNVKARNNIRKVLAFMER